MLLKLNCTVPFYSVYHIPHPVSLSPVLGKEADIQDCNYCWCIEGKETQAYVLQTGLKSAISTCNIKINKSLLQK